MMGNAGATKKQQHKNCSTQIIIKNGIDFISFSDIVEHIGKTGESECSWQSINGRNTAEIGPLKNPQSMTI